MAFWNRKKNKSENKLNDGHKLEVTSASLKVVENGVTKVDYRYPNTTVRTTGGDYNTPPASASFDYFTYPNTSSSSSDGSGSCDSPSDSGSYDSGSSDSGGASCD